ncbi:hypothetical protein JTB14_029050 [Gonioctena quinquepunctata]|nr:hypothetical protein JTB14_029050 [Gonioctena quinquepunctata]
MNSEILSNVEKDMKVLNKAHLTISQKSNLPLLVIKTAAYEALMEHYKKELKNRCIELKTPLKARNQKEDSYDKVYPAIKNDGFITPRKSAKASVGLLLQRAAAQTGNSFEVLQESSDLESETNYNPKQKGPPKNVKPTQKGKISNGMPAIVAEGHLSIDQRIINIWKKELEAPLPKEVVWDGRSRSHLGDQDERSRSRPGYKGEKREDRSERRIQANQGSPPIPYTPPPVGTDPPLYGVGGNEGFAGLMNPNATIDSVKKKINNLRCTFRKELKKLRKSKRSGEGSDNVYVPTLWYFNLMFTTDQEEPRTSISNDTQSDEETEIECEFQNDPDETESDNDDMEDNSHVSLDDVPETPIVIDRPYRTPSRNSASQPPSRTPSRSSASQPPSRTPSRTATATNRPGIKRSRESIIEKACESLYSQNQDEFDAVGSNPNQANIYTTAETNKKHPAGTSKDTCTMYTIMESRQAYQQELSKSNNGRQSCHASVNYQVYNPNETNIYTTAENILSGNDTSYNEHAAGPSNDTTFNIRTENNSHQASRQDLSEFVTFQK